MKGLKKIALASAVAAAPFAAQAGGLEPLNDQQMGDVTGQAGVTIELQTQVNIDQFSYTQDTEGSFVVDNIAVGGHERDGDGNIDSTFDASMDIDLTDEGDALISFGGLHNDGTNDIPVLLGFDFDRAGLEGEADAQATLMSDFTMDMYLTQLDITASTESLDPVTAEPTGTRDSEAGHIAIDVGFAMDIDMDFDVAAVGLRGMSMAGVGSIDALQASGGDGGAGLAAAGPAVVNMTISPGTPIGTYSGLDQQPEEALIVAVDNFSADMWIDEIRIGRDGGEIGASQSIGSVGMAGLEVTNTRLAIYGRD